MRINLIPMAGEGLRFKNAGYSIPKPLININGMPMVVRAANGLPPADKYIFVCRKEHLVSFPIEATLRQHFNDPVIVTVDHLTEGQAISCMLAREYIPDNAILTIGASDNDMTYDENMVEGKFMDKETDAWIWTFRHNPVVLQNPEQYGWVRCNNSTLRAQEVSCKKPISTDPVNDHAVIGAFTFKKAHVFFDAVTEMIKTDTRINNEFYVDVALNFIIETGYKVDICEVEQYICWGTPKDYEEYQRWLQYFKKRIDQ